MKKCILIAITFIVGWYLVVDIVRNMQGKDLLFFERWFFSDRGYAKNIEIKSYILTDEQAAWVLAHPEEEVKQPTQKELYLKPVNIVIRIKNKSYAWGTLAYRFKNHNWNCIDVDFSRPSKIEEQYYNFVLPKGILIADNSDEVPENVQIHWESLYTYP